MLHAPVSEGRIGSGRLHGEPMASAAHRPSPIGNQAMLRAIRPATGNQAALRTLRAPHPSVMRRKLEVGRADDPLEHEADRVAEQVMRMPNPEISLRPASLQLSRKCAACEEVEKLQRKPVGPSHVAAPAPAIVHDVLRSPGAPLDSGTRTFMEPRFGRDFGDVRVHADARAAESARAVDATAYTVGRDVVFAAGRYAPRTDAGRQLLAHELAHVVQQQGSRGLADGGRLQRQAGPFSQTPKEIPSGTGAADFSKLQDLLGGNTDATTIASLINLCAMKQKPLPDGCTKDAVDGLKDLLKKTPKNFCAGLPGFTTGKGSFAGQCCDSASVVQNDDHCCNMDRVNFITNQCCPHNHVFDARSGNCVVLCPVGQEAAGEQCCAPGVKPTILGTCPSATPATDTSDDSSEPPVDAGTPDSPSAVPDDAAIA